ncbi:flagellar hook-associated protein 2 [Clostridium pasteurianum DSM 525 = ATCC 6013]|uniref:Flagellar hook-associated protein 2 n=1 Tax=Clostridium pasteurianum DSM 525 = ATCC 6013 TaxID=1262449 RepID=A0A0H3J1R9_CLOPA|nr:flagellar filament capping protein FliD [Clostridium pasteurianum]AJA47846.1 flagellar hook-associated protein 2 [Clostridium pasteurianum DSM 525 = ATCC 6013]AJA51834.1 flagellar hook-associated protein 2 [Clostridium pasteurianum DSM 525 = ATCC 6013]AOZ75137.1 flagellar capping protein [Clostridium pasteurianum DSM 525 = ATCC 6013]AOZ78932.1 flagellar capping protein [Clostridium pasteurianum]ELP59747.1 flagellar cap protein fliD [Clostridium pasteurianum DSM 525 = ATCC 6013]
MSDISSTSTTTTGMTGAGGGSMIRITGMASGLDVDAIVKKMLVAEQNKIDKAKQDQQTIQWKQEAYQDIIKDIKDLQNTYFNSLDSANNILSSSNYAGFDSSVADSTVLSVTPGVSSQTGTYKVDFTDGHLAATASVSTTDKVSSSSGDASLSSTMKDLGMSGSTGTFDITYNGTTKTITVNSTDKLSDVINNISNATSGAVMASFSQLTGKFTIQTANTGSAQNITVSNDSGSSLTALGITTGSSGTGEDAVVKITPPGGIAVTVTKSTNNFTIDGITYNLQSAQGADEGKSTTFTITQNTQKVYDKINDFLDKYNAIVDKIQTKLSEKKSYDYPPLTDAQRSSMSASQITDWETKAKTGILRNDENLQSLLTSMRSAFTTAVSNTGLSFGKYGSNSIGLDTSSDITEGGKITIVDEQKFKAAIAEHGDQILKLFTNISDSTDKTTKFNESGIFQRLSSIFVDNVGYTGTTLNSAILTKYANYQGDYSIYGSSGTNTLPDQLYRQTLLIKKLNSDFSDKQEKYYQQFSALETALTQMNAQQSMLSQYGM